MQVTAAKLAELHGVEVRTVTNWRNSDPPCPSIKDGNSRLFDTAAVFRWMIQREVSKALANQTAPAPTDIADAERRKLSAEALMAEIKVAQLEETLIPIEVHEEAFATLGDRLMSVIQNVPSTYALDLERAGVPAGEAMAVLEKVSDQLVRAFRVVADEIDELGDDNDDSNSPD